MSTGEDGDEAWEGAVKSDHEAPRSTPVVWGKTKALVFRPSDKNPLSQWGLMDMLEPSAVPIEDALKDMANGVGSYHHSGYVPQKVVVASPGQLRENTPEASQTPPITASFM